MTVVEVITKIGKMRQSIDYLTQIADKYDMTAEEVITITDSIDCLDEYIDILENKIVK